MIDNPLRKALESIDDHASDEFREALRQRCLAELVVSDATDRRRSGPPIDDQFVPMKEMSMSPIDPPTSNTTNRRRLLMIAAAVVVVIGVAGVLFANNNTDNDQAPSAAVAATAAPTTTIAATTSVAPTTQTVSFAVDFAPDISVTFTVPQSWTVLEGWSAYMPSTDDRSAVVGLAFEPIGNIFADGCQWVQLEPPAGPSVDDLVEAWANQTDFATTEPVDVTIDGYAGKHIEFTVPDYNREDCKESHFGLWYPGTDPLPGTVPPGYWAQGPRQHIQQRILDVGGTRLVISSGILPSASAQERAALDAAIASIEIN